MAFIVKTVKTVRNNWKKSLAAGVAVYFVGRFAARKYNEDLLRREFCKEAKKYGKVKIGVTDKPRRIIVFLNPASASGGAVKSFNKNAAPILHLAGIEVNVVKVCYYIVLFSQTKPLKPTLTLNAEHPFVGDNITFTCHSTIQRWPAGYRTSHLTYQFNGKPRGVTVNNKLTIHTLTMSDEGKVISCQATDDLQKASIKSDAVTLDPYYGPDNVMLEPVHTALNVTKGNILGPINCTATCNPKCLFEWRLNRTGTFVDVLSNETLVVANIKENQAGIYRCLVVHPLNRTRLRRTDISVNVQYSPKIESLWLSDKNETYGSGRHTIYSFNEGNHLTITLRIKSNPDPQIVINSSLMKFPKLHYTKRSDDFTTKLPSLKCENSGNFTIHASNGIAYGDKKTVNLEIKCKPRDVKAELKIGTKVDTDVNIVMNVVSFPTPTVTWLRMTEFVWTVLKDKYDYKHNISSTIRITSKDDFGVHGIKICNTLGCIVENITLQPGDKPEAPLYFSVEKTTSISVNLSWIVGFNGGHEQTFSIQFKTTDSDQATKIVQTSDTKTGSKVYYILDQLKPDTMYHVMVLSTNKYGNRNASLEFKTEGKMMGFLKEESELICFKRPPTRSSPSMSRNGSSCMIELCLFRGFESRIAFISLSYNCCCTSLRTSCCFV
ncbi:acylglycerol kinase [Mytilus galloprovincialis]|uniref:Acylglycerol kinase n=1 Tax=Mytilus galloprovincialis TaxID=29158 RepID=A0A8B6HCK2_MYTGA|nr:acylglycerol kinase [Mytilus galloprovincialis]